MVRLLCRAHELEVENTELQADSLCRRSLLCQKDFVIQRYHQHRLLCEQLLRDQRQLIEGEADRRRTGSVRGGAVLVLRPRDPPQAPHTLRPVTTAHARPHTP